MILKSFELKKFNLRDQSFYLFYGDNEGLKEEIINSLFENKFIWKYVIILSSYLLCKKLLWSQCWLVVMAGSRLVW